jgi:hypothetical protein
MIHFDRMFNYFVLINLPKTIYSIIHAIYSFCPIFSTSFNSLPKSFKLAETNANILTLVMTRLNYAIQRSMNNRTAFSITAHQHRERFSKGNMNCKSSVKETDFEQILQRLYQYVSSQAIVDILIQYCILAFCCINVNYNTRGNQKVPGILWHGRFCAPWVRTAWTECYWSFICASLERFRDAVRRKWRDKWQTGTVVSASRQRSEPYIACCVITQPPYSPDLDPSLFRRLQLSCF